MSPVVDAHLEQQVVAQDARVVDEDGGGAQFVGDALDSGLDARLVGHVTADGERVAAVSLDGVHRCGTGSLVEVDDGNLQAVGGETLGDGRADAARGTGDDGGSLGHGYVLSSGVRGFRDAQKPPVSVMPPSIGSVWPVTQAASSEARKATGPAMSSGRPRRLSGYGLATSSSRPS